MNRRILLKRGRRRRCRPMSSISIKLLGPDAKAITHYTKKKAFFFRISNGSAVRIPVEEYTAEFVYTPNLKER